MFLWHLIRSLRHAILYSLSLESKASAIGHTRLHLSYVSASSRKAVVLSPGPLRPSCHTCLWQVSSHFLQIGSLFAHLHFLSPSLDPMFSSTHSVCVGNTNWHPKARLKPHYVRSLPLSVSRTAHKFASCSELSCRLSTSLTPSDAFSQGTVGGGGVGRMDCTSPLRHLLSV